MQTMPSMNFARYINWVPRKRGIPVDLGNGSPLDRSYETTDETLIAHVTFGIQTHS